MSMTSRVVGYNLNHNKQLFIALTAIYGIGRSSSLNICKNLKMNPFLRVKDLDNDHIGVLNSYISEKYKYGEELKKAIYDNVKKLVNMKSYRGGRLKNGLPARGQRSKTNSKTSKKLMFKIL